MNSSSVLYGTIRNLLPTALSTWGDRKIFVLIDENTKEHCLPIVRPFLPEDFVEIKIPSGEINKNLNTCTRIWEDLTSNSADRNSVLINLGGGVIGDMGGFCASTYKRGISFINVPTTLLSQVDASVGGKLGIDFNHLKNHIGLFQTPDFVLIDTIFLKTLPERQVRSGFAEVVKHSLIKDVRHWEHIRNEGYDHLNWDSIIPVNVGIKEAIVNSDFKEAGARKLLNFGHTVGHAIETFILEKGGDILHGEAIAAGMIIESYLSEKLSTLELEERDEITSCVINWFGKIELRPEDYNQLITLMKQDKKNKNGEILCTLLSKIGNGIYDQPVMEDIIIESLEYYNNL